MMAAQGVEDVYASLLLTDDYLPGALVLAHSLRDAGTTKKLAILVTLDSISSEVITQLKAVYDYVIPVPRIRNGRPANLYLMNRPDLHSAFTKINLWKQTQFRKIVYLDADVVAYRAPDELFDLPHAFSAAPDIGWPDLFNTGVMVLTPNMGDYYALMAMADRGISFDGADQGLLNMHFKNTYNRLSFTYNVTPSAHYQYVPAYMHFQSSISMVHFIGSEKPWVSGREKSTGSSPFDEIVGRWWAVYDRHYRKEVTSSQPQQTAPEIVQYFVKGEYQPRVNYRVPAGEPSRDQPLASYGQQQHQPSHSPVPPPLHFEHQDQRQDQRQQHHEHHDFQHDFSRDPPAQQHSEYHGFAPQVQDHHHHPQHDHPHHDHHREQHYDQRHDQHQDQHHDQRQDQHHGQSHDQRQDQHHDQHQHDPHTAQHYEQPQYHHHHHHHEQSQPGSSIQISTHPIPPPSESVRSEEGKHTEAREGQEPEHQKWAPHSSPPQSKPEHIPEPQLTISWDAQRQPPPPDSKPEALNFPQTHYEMSSDVAPFVPPERYPSPPKDMWYEVPKERPAQASAKPKAIFPWETHQPRASRVFVHPEPEPERAPSPVAQSPPTSTAQAEPSVTGSSTVEHKSEPQTPTQPVIPIPWSSFPRTNAWDDIPEITRYVDTIQKHRRTRSQGLGVIGAAETSLGGEQSWGRRGSKVTDFPSVDDRPSLPVTPAPIRRPRFWGGGGPGLGTEGEDDDEKLPAAEGVPVQSDWDPIAQLQKLAKQQSEMLLQKLGRSGSQGGEAVMGTEGKELPSRPFPFGSEDAKSPTYVAPSSGVLSPKPVKPEGGSGSVHHILAADKAGEISHTHITGPSHSITQPSYGGPGASFEKGEDISVLTPALPTEEEQDVLET